MERKPHCLHSNRFSKCKTFPNNFWSCYSASLDIENTVSPDIENTVATPNEFFYLKKFIHINKKKQFFLSPLTATNTTIFLSNISKLKHNQIIRIKTQKHNFIINQIITIKAKKKKKTETIWPIWTALGTKMSDSTVTYLSCSFSLYLFSFFSYCRES